MKNYIFMLILVLVSLAFSEFEITKHKGFTSIGSGYMINAERFTGNSLTDIAIPYGIYQLEGKTDEKSMYYLYANGGLRINKFSSADELPTGELPSGSTNESFAYDLGLFVNPMIKYFMKDSTFATIGLPFYFVSKQKESVTRPEDDMMITSDMQLDITATFGYDARDIEFHILSPWDNFEEGIAAYGFFSKGLLKSYTDWDTRPKSPLNQPTFIFGAEGCYSYLLEDFKLLLKPIVRYEQQLNDETYQYWWLSSKVFAAWDYSKKININGTLGMKFGETGESEEDVDYNPKNNLAGNTTWFMIEAEVNYYVKPELNIFFGFKGESLLFAVQDQDEWQRNASELNIRLGATYQINFVNEY